MKKLFGGLTALFSFLGFGLFVFGAPPTTVQTKPAMQWHCLQNVYCAKQGANCTTKGAAGIGPVMGHRVKLTTRSTDLPARNAPTGVFVCIGTKQGNICTSGDGSFDKKMLGYNGLATLGQVSQYEFQGLFRSSDGSRVAPSSIVSNAGGKLSNQIGNKVQVIEPIEMQDYTPVSLPRKWLALNLIKTIPLAVGKGGEQQGTFTFEGALGKCAAITWDPYGIVFDSQSLEPVAGIQVTLMKKRDNGQYTIAAGDDAPSILNPITTVEDGQYEIYVPDGIYRLDLKSSNFIFPNKAKLNPNYSKVYSDIYRGEDIIEKGETIHRDVPIDSKTTPHRAPVKIIAYAPLFDKGTNTMIIQGKVSHPLTKVNVYGKKPLEDKQDTYVRTRLLTSFTADKVGEFDFRYQMNKLQQNELIGDIEFVKPDYLGKQSETAVVIKNDTLTVEPILNHIEGYAYDQNGKPIPNAKVGVYLELSSEPAYETIADTNGFYRISSEYLPPMIYKIKYSGPNGTTSVSTSKFIAQNAKYLKTQGENLFVFKNNKGRTLTVAERVKFTGENEPTPPSSISTSSTNQSGNKAVTQGSTQLASSLLPVVIILVLIGLGGVAAIVYFMKKK